MTHRALQPLGVFRDVGFHVVIHLCAAETVESVNIQHEPLNMLGDNPTYTPEKVSPINAEPNVL